MGSRHKLRIGILTTLDSPLLPIHLEAILEKGFTEIVIICDTKVTDPRDFKIWLDRTGGLAGFYGFRESTAELLINSMSPLFFVGSHNDSGCERLIAAQELNVLINSGTPRKLLPALLGSSKFGVVNVHPGVLPKYRGSCAVEWSIFNDDKIGNTVHFMDEGYDSGPIIDIETYDLSATQSYHQIRSNIYSRSGPLIANALEKISLGMIDISTAQKQDHQLAHYWKPIETEKMKSVMEKISLRYPLDA